MDQSTVCLLSLHLRHHGQIGPGDRRSRLRPGLRLEAFTIALDGNEGIVGGPPLTLYGAEAPNQSNCPKS